jgi:hypothetical protein
LAVLVIFSVTDGPRAEATTIPTGGHDAFLNPLDKMLLAAIFVVGQQRKWRIIGNPADKWALRR